VGENFQQGQPNRLIGPFWITRAGLIERDSGCPWSPHLDISGTPLSLSRTFVTAGRNGDAVSFDLTPIFDPKSQRPEPKVQPAHTVTLDAREGRNRALLMCVRAPCSIDNPSAKFESWILVKSAPLTRK